METEMLKLTHRLLDRATGKKVVAYRGYFTEEPCKGQEFLYDKSTLWLCAREGQVENVIAYGNPIFPEWDDELGYKYKVPQSELDKMHLRGINGFKITSLPCELDIV